MAVAFLSAMFVGTACTEEWDDHYSDNGANTKNGTMLEYLKSDGSFSDFCAVVDALGCADSLLNQSRAYTLWAPVNGSFNKQEMLDNIAAGKREWVLQRFVKSHMADYLKPASEAMDDNNFILLLNEKMVVFAGDYQNGYTFDGLEVVADSCNIRLSNGIIHKIRGSVNYALNLWEYLEIAENVDSVAEFLYSFNVMEFDEFSSIQGPTIKGQQTYLDSQFTNSNIWFSTGGDKYSAGIGKITAEDSTYCMFVPTNDVWTEMVPKIEKLFNYYADSKATDAVLAENDSLRKYYARRMLLNHMVFSTKDQPAVSSDSNGNIDENGDGQRDSLISTYSAYNGKRRLFSVADLMDGSDAGVECSNGTFYTKSNFNFSPFYLWHDTIQVEAEKVDYQGETRANSKVKFVESGEAYTRYVAKNAVNPSIPEGDKRNLTYVEAVGSSTGAKPSLLWTIPEVLSGSYYVGAVIVPEFYDNSDSLTTEQIAAYQPSKLVITVQANTGSGTPKNLEKSVDLYNDPTRLDTLWVAGKDGNRIKVKFPYSEFGYDKLKTNVTVKVASNVGRQEKDYNKKFRVDFVILEPVEDDVE